MQSCRIYIQNLTKDEKVQEKLTSFHNVIFQRLIDSKLFNKWHDHYFLPPVGDGRYTKAQALIQQINAEYKTPVSATAFTKAHQKEYVFVNVKNLLPRAEEQAKGAEQGTFFQKNPDAVNATLKIVDALRKSPRNTYPSNQVNGFYNDLRKYGASEQQISLLKEYIAKNNIKEINKQDLITGFMADMSYTVEINTAMYEDLYKKGYFASPSVYGEWGVYDGQGNTFQDQLTEGEAKRLVEKLNNNESKPVPTSHYSNLTVPGGTNYTENEIRTPAITPSIKGHAQFSTDNGIGWFRSDDKVDNAQLIREENKNKKENLIRLWGNSPKYKELLSHNIQVFNSKETGDSNYGGGILVDLDTNKQYYLHPDDVEPLLNTETTYEKSDYLDKQVGGELTKTRRILEVQSDVFQKGRDIKSPDEIIQELQKQGKLKIKCD